MARTKKASPTLALQITEAQHERAVASASGGCLIADAIKEQYPNLTGITVDMATIRVSDRDLGLRYTYLTPPLAQHLLLAFDQGWPNPTETVVIKRAVKVTPITRSPAAAAATDAQREVRRLEYKSRVDAGEKLTPRELAAYDKVSNPKPRPERPATPGPVEVFEDENRGTVVYGGKAPVQGPAHPNLLRGRDRHFGAKLADPGQAFHEAVEAAVAERLGEKPA